MPDEASSVPLRSVKDELDRAELSLADNEEIIHALNELTPIFENDRSYFVLGNYDREPIRRLNLVVDRLNRRPDAYAFRMIDVRSEWDNSIQKFCVIADVVSCIVGVAEKEPSDFLVEQGVLVGTSEYFSKSYVLQRTYDDPAHPFEWLRGVADLFEDDEDPFGWMQHGVFELFDEAGRLYRWRTEADLVDVTGELP